MPIQKARTCEATPADPTDQSSDEHTIGEPAQVGMATPQAVARFIRDGSPFVTIQLTPGVEISEF